MARRFSQFLIFVLFSAASLFLIYYLNFMSESLQLSDKAIPTHPHPSASPDSLSRTDDNIIMSSPVKPGFRRQFLHPQCGMGVWQRKYSTLHDEMRARKLKDQRIAVMDAYRNGAGDRLTMTVTVFLYSLLTDRMFKIKWAGAKLEEALKPHWVDWRFQESDLDEKYGKVVFKDYMTMMLGYEDMEINVMFRERDLHSLANDTVRAVRMTLNQGQIWTLFDNPLYSKQLYEWGLTPENAYGCVMSFLFELHPEAIRESMDEWKQVLQVDDPVSYMSLHQYAFEETPNTKTIAIQIRYGDGVMQNQNECKNAYQSDAWSKKFFACAQQIESDLSKSGVITRYFVMSDCLYIGVDAAKHLGDEKVVHSMETAKHIEVAGEEIHVLRKALAEAYLFSMADFHIISSGSSFGRLGALMSLRWNHIFAFDNWSRHTGLDKTCHIKDWETWKSVSHYWIRV